MRKGISVLAVILLMGMPTAVSAQFKNILNSVKSAVENVVEQPKFDLQGQWAYKGSAVDLKSNNLLKNLGGKAATSVAEGKINSELKKIGIVPGSLEFEFRKDSTFTTALAGRKLNGSYSYNEADRDLTLTFAKVVNFHAKVKTGAQEMSLLFNSDKLFKFLIFLSQHSGDKLYQTIGKLGEQYDGMALGMELKRQ